MSTSSTQFYSANVSDFKTMKVDKAIWEVELKKLEDSTCAHWTNKGFKIKEIVSSILLNPPQLVVTKHSCGVRNTLAIVDQMSMYLKQVETIDPFKKNPKKLDVLRVSW